MTENTRIILPPEAGSREKTGRQKGTRSASSYSGILGNANEL